MIKSKKLIKVVITSVLFSCLSQMNAYAASRTGQFSASIYQNMNSDWRIAYTSHVDRYGFNAALGTCEEELRDACIESVDVEIDGTWHKLIASSLSEGETSCPGCSGYDALWSGNPDASLPAGHRPSRWKGEGLSIGVEVVLNGSSTANNDINPVRDSLNHSGTYFVYSASIRINPEQGQQFVNKKYRVVIKPRLQRKAFAGFYEGRLQGGEIAFPSEDQISFSGNPALVTLSSTPVWNFAEVPTPIKSMFEEMARNAGLPSQYDISKLGPSDNSVFFSFNNNVAQFETIEPYLDQTTAKDRYAWSLTNQQNVPTASKGKCLENQFGIGMATTNASMYTAGLPEWDATSQTLRYFMASPHFTAKGTPAVGNYDLSLAENVARCIWGIAKIPEVATFEITYSDGSSEVGTITLGVRSGFVNFHVNGFHFSSPKISLKLEDGAPKTIPSPLPSPSVTNSPALPNTSSSALRKISCVKGKKIIVVKGSNPKCPTGFKRTS